MATAYWPGARQLDAGLLGPFAEQGIGNLNQDAGAIAHQRIGAHRAAMVEIDQKLQAQPDDLMGLGALDVGDKANAASVMLVARVIKTLFRRQTHQNQTPTTYERDAPLPPSPESERKPGNARFLEITRHVNTPPVAAQHARYAQIK